MKFLKKAGSAAIAAAILCGASVYALPQVSETLTADAAVVLTLNKGIANLGVGENLKLTANTKVTWRTSDPSVVTVDSAGNVKAKGKGTAWVTGRTPAGAEKSCKFTIKPAPKSIALTKGILTLGVGEKYTLGSNINSGAACSKRTYRTSSSAVVRMTRTDWQGDFVAVKPGVAYVTVRTYNGKESTCKVTVRPAPQSVKLSRGLITLKKGEKASLSAVIPDGSGCASRTFRSSNSSVVKMTKTNWTGEFTAMSVGTAYVTVRTYNGKEASCRVDVKPPVVDVTSITLNKTSVTLEEGKTTTLTATVNPSNATNKNVTWSSNNTNVATVNNGTVTANITAKSNNGKTATCKVTIKAKATSNITYINVLGNAVIDKNKTTGNGSVRIYSDSKNVDLSTFKVTLKNNTDNIVSYTKYIANEQYYDGEVDLSVLFTAKTANRTKDYIVTAVITCGNKSEEMSIIVECEKDESVKAYYAPFDIDQIVKDMRKYGESHGMTWDDSKYVKFNDKTDPTHQDPITNSSFFIPMDSRVTGLTLKQQLLDSVLWPYEKNKVYDPWLKIEEISFKVVPIYCKASDFWEFYVLY